ncbi:type-F conjugative transfer system protein TrbI [Sphingomonas sp.]|uniref:type-F conjugative transfer system protein TrbI n=1 Tax=Sphingomonas sp. TaxID=28214 RepID=UPI00307F5369
MAEQRELDLPEPPRPSAKRALFGGFTRSQIFLGLVLLGALVWGMWVTKLLVAPRQDRIVSARLSAIVGEYVQAQARSASPPSQVEAEMRNFMTSLDRELQSRSAQGQIVLVGEAVLTKNVPDITDSLKNAVYASGVARPRQASAEELQRLEQQAMAAAQPQVPMQPAGPAAYVDPMAAAQGMPASSGPQIPGRQYAPPAASVSTFGGPDGAGGQ